MLWNSPCLILRQTQTEATEHAISAARRSPDHRVIGHSECVSIDVLFAGIAVADFEAALVWYERLWGRPPDIVPNDDEVMWRITEAGWMYVLADSERAGASFVSVAVSDLDYIVAQLADRGLATEPIEIVGDAGRKATAVDPEGNRVSFIEVTRHETP
jgi:predicted enzyme related to lactoylglutathione lyase